LFIKLHITNLTYTSSDFISSDILSQPHEPGHRFTAQRSYTTLQQGGCGSITLILGKH